MDSSTAASPLSASLGAIHESAPDCADAYSGYEAADMLEQHPADGQSDHGGLFAQRSGSGAVSAREWLRVGLWLILRRVAQP